MQDPDSKFLDRRAHRSQQTLLAVTAALLLAVFVPFYLATLDLHWPIPRDGTGLVVGRDFLNFWMYGRAATAPSPEQFYHLQTYWAASEAVTGSPYPHQLWSYPPSVMLLAAPFGRLPYGVALVLWTVIGMCCFAGALRLWMNERPLLFACLFAPAAVFGIMSGQFALLATAVVLVVLRWRESRPVLAGFLLGLLTLKPQLGLFFPILLLATQNWRLIAAAVITSLLIAGATAAFWGVDIWLTYIGQGLANQSLVLSDPDKLGGPFMPTLFMNMRVAGAPFEVAMAIQAAGAMIGIWLVWKTFRARPAPTDLSANAVFVAASVFGTPYLLSYDTLGLAVFAALLATRGEGGRWLPILCYLLPLLQFSGLPGPALVPLVAGWKLARLPQSQRIPD